MQNKIPTLIAWFLLISISLASCSFFGYSTEPDEENLSLVFMAGYKPQANLPFVGVYLAQEKGFFAEENLDVTIEHSAGQGQHLQFLTAGKVDVTTQDASVLLKRRANPGLPLLSFALIGQTGQQAFAALASSGMTTPADWAGHIIGYKGAIPPELTALLSMHQITADDAQIVNVGFDPRLLTEGQVDVYPVYKANEPYLIESWGYPVTLWDPADYGVPTLGLAYVTSDEILKNKQEALVRFTRAVLRAIDYAGLHPDEAVDAVMLYAGPETDRAHMAYMLEQELKDAKSSLMAEHGTGWQTHEQWQALADFLAAYDAMPPLDVDDVFTTKILEQAQWR